ncbi:unnamed protein product [Closterium sp. NIES-65]|nr:unnamed protein product [Closterium sp. NIES-65]
MMYLVSPVAIILLLIARWLTGGGAGERRWLTGGGAGERRWLTGRCGGAVNDGGDATGATTGRAERGKRGGGAVNDGGDAAGAVVALLVLLELTRVHVARYQEDDDVATRREAAVCCAQFNEGAGEEREERWRGERGALCEEREERWRGERGALARRERSAGEEREERWRGERGALARRERSAGEEREERWRGERGALARRERSAGEEREERWRGERGALARRERSAGEESEERWRGEERWHGEGVLGGECVRKLLFPPPLCSSFPCHENVPPRALFLHGTHGILESIATSEVSLLPPLRPGHTRY